MAIRPGSPAAKIATGAKNVAKVAAASAGGRLIGEAVGNATHPLRQVVRGAEILHDRIGTAIPVDHLVTVGQQAHDAAVQTGHWAGGLAAATTAAVGIAMSRKNHMEDAANNARR